MWELAETGYRNLVADGDPAPRKTWRFVAVPRHLLLIAPETIRTRSHLCRMSDHVSPHWFIRGVTPHSPIRRW